MDIHYHDRMNVKFVNITMYVSGEKYRQEVVPLFLSRNITSSYSVLSGMVTIDDQTTKIKDIHPILNIIFRHRCTDVHIQYDWDTCTLLLLGRSIGRWD